MRWISYIHFYIIYFELFLNCSEGLQTNQYTISKHIARSIHHQIVNLTSVQSVKVVLKLCLVNCRTSLFFFSFHRQNYLCALIIGFVCNKNLFSASHQWWHTCNMVTNQKDGKHNSTLHMWQCWDIWTNHGNVHTAPLCFFFVLIKIIQSKTLFIVLTQKLVRINLSWIDC